MEITDYLRHWSMLDFFGGKALEIGCLNTAM